MNEMYVMMTREEQQKEAQRLECVIWQYEMMDRMDADTKEKWREACRALNYLREVAKR